MLPTHILASVLLFFLLPTGELTVFSLIVILLGGVLPDLDILFSHRSSLHFPLFYPIGAFLALVLAVQLAFYFLLAASVHCFMDFLGNNAGKFVEEDKGAVFNHVRGEWIEGRKLIQIDGGNKDLAI